MMYYSIMQTCMNKYILIELKFFPEGSVLSNVRRTVDVMNPNL